MDMNWLMDFDCLARTLSFTRASTERNITQSAFSRRIKSLEAWIGLPLLNRDTYPVQLTDAGAQFLPVARETIARLNEVRQSIRDADRRDRRFVRFSSLHTISANFLAKRLENMQVSNPNLRTTVLSDSLSTCCDLLTAGAVDILLCYYHAQVSPLIDETIFTRKDVAQDRLMPVALSEAVETKEWSLAHETGMPLPYLAYDPSTFLGMVVEHTIGRRRLNAEIIYIDGLVETIKRRVLAGSGFAWLPETAIAAELDAGELVVIGPKDWCAPLTISALSNLDTLDPIGHDIWGRM